MKPNKKTQKRKFYNRSSSMAKRRKSVVEDGSHSDQQDSDFDVENDMLNPLETSDSLKTKKPVGDAENPSDTENPSDDVDLDPSNTKNPSENMVNPSDNMVPSENVENPSDNMVPSENVENPSDNMVPSENVENPSENTVPSVVLSDTSDSVDPNSTAFSMNDGSTAVASVVPISKTSVDPQSMISVTVDESITNPGPPSFSTIAMSYRATGMLLEQEMKKRDNDIGKATEQSRTALNTARTAFNAMQNFKNHFTEQMKNLKLREQLKTLTEKNDALEATINSNMEQMSALTAKNAALEAMMETLQTQMSDFLVKVTAIQEANTPKKKGNLKQIVSVLQVRIQQLEDIMLKTAVDDE